MLPTHVRRPLSFADTPTAPKSNLLIGRPLLRWVSWSLVCIGALWIFVPMAMNLGRPPMHVYSPSTHSVLDGDHKPRPHAPWNPLPPSPQGSPTIWSERAARVREAFVHAYSGYQRYALPYDELLPKNGGRANNFNGWGVSVFDSMDTMWIMGLHDMFHDSLEVVGKATFALKENSFAPFFETVIRYLGGLLSAYALSGEPILLTRADDLGRMLLPAFNTTSGFPMYAINTVTGKTRSGWSGNVLWSEALSNQMEYKYLAHLTGRKEYYEKTERIMHRMYETKPKDGIFPTMWDVNSGAPANKHFSVGAYADSAHEYLLKQWLVTGQSEPKTRELYLVSVNAIINNLLYITPKRNLLYVTDTQSGKASHVFEHLSCFLPGLLALGVHTLDLPVRDRELHSWAAEGLAYTCWMTYADQVTGLGPDEMTMKSWSVEGQGKWMEHVKEWEKEGRPGQVPPGLREISTETEKEDRDYSHKKLTYLLRPETVESFYILWRTTGNEKWRERGWSVFEAIEKHSRTSYGYASVLNVDKLPVSLLDEMPSYFLAETLKYLFLLFTDDDLIPLKDWVFNTEAHPIPVFHWKSWEKVQYNIPQ